jgi:hypothetical protein
MCVNLKALDSSGYELRKGSATFQGKCSSPEVLVFIPKQTKE